MAHMPHQVTARLYGARLQRDDVRRKFGSRVARCERWKNTAQRARATVKVRIADGDDEDRLDVAEGSGPVDALAAALVRSLAPTFPFVDSIRLVDYKVRILDPHSATRAATRVECTFKEKITGKVWTTVSVTGVISRRRSKWTALNSASSSTRTCMLCEVDYDAPPIYSSDDARSSSVQAMPRECGRRVECWGKLINHTHQTRLEEMERGVILPLPQAPRVSSFRQGHQRPPSGEG